EDYNRRVRRASGFVLPSAARMRAFETPGGKALFSCHPLPESRLAPGRLRMTTIRSHDQFNTTIYGFDDRYRGIRGDRRVIFVNASDAGEQGVADGDEVDVTSHFDGERRVLTKIRVVIYDVPKGCAAMYYPEANPLVALGSMAEKSQTPAYKNVEISVSPSGTSRSGSPSPS
ncbi:MAG: molybdopterin dinucleotide binding domain-containing protein, partial [Gaiellales bacterium]